MNLNFKGPYTKKDLDDLKCLDKNAIGIYIWGFSYSEINGAFKLLDNEIASEYLVIKRIPYYVGCAGKNTGIYKTINDRHLKNIGSETKYLRLTKKYLCDFFKDINFPERCEPRLKWIKKTCENYENEGKDFFDTEEGCISYINELFFFNKMNIPVAKKVRKSNPKTENKDYPLSLLNNKEEIAKRDTYSFLEQNPDSFFFIYANLKDNNEFEKLVNKYSEIKVLETLETFTKFSLQGKTIGDSKSSKKLNERLEEFEIKKIDIKLINKDGNDITRNYFLPIPRIENQLDPTKKIYGL